MGLREDLVAINEQLGKARSEIVSKISDLESAVANSGQVTPEPAEESPNEETSSPGEA